MRKKRNFTSAIALILTIGLIFLLGKKTEEVQEQVDNFMDHKKEKEIIETTKTRPTRNHVSYITGEKLQELRTSFPDKNILREEVARDPHEIPPSLIHFSTILGPLMEIAYESKKDAVLLISALQDCALDDTVAESARALCVSNAHKLGDIYEELKERANEIEFNTPEGVKTLLKKKNLLMKNGNNG